jgi:hypothetical protein
MKQPFFGLTLEKTPAFSPPPKALDASVANLVATHHSLGENGGCRSSTLGCWPDHDLLGLHDALELLVAHDPVKAKHVNLRFFTGFTLREAAYLAISPSTADRAWRYPGAWLRAATHDAKKRTRRDVQDEGTCL